MSFDCQRCGACCCNPRENREEGFLDWVEIESDAPLLRRRQLASRLVTRGRDGRPHLRLDARQRCSALRGEVGARVHCEIYPLRPRACHKVTAGSPRCLQYREEFGIADADAR